MADCTVPFGGKNALKFICTAVRDNYTYKKECHDELAALGITPKPGDVLFEFQNAPPPNAPLCGVSFCEPSGQWKAIENSYPYAYTNSRPFVQFANLGVGEYAYIYYLRTGN